MSLDWLAAISPWQVITGIVLAVLFSWISFRLRFLSGSGALGAAILGIVIFGFGGLSWTVLLLAFFITSSGLSKWLKHKKQPAIEKFAKGSTRDIGQVFANGGVAALFVILHLFFPQQAWPWLAYAGALAAVNADTWATELGVSSKARPIHIISGRKVEKGTSGGVSVPGTLSALAGALLIGILAVAVWPAQTIAFDVSQGWLVMITVALAGLFGSLIDSFLGATLQTMYFCPHCQKETERYPRHLCGTVTQYMRGSRWLNNDWVNVFCAAAGSLAMLLSSIA